jgi:hypothetical protein
MAVAITATEQTDYPPRVLISVTGLDIGDTIILYRSVGGERAEIRAGYSLAVEDTSFLRIDAELPFGVAVSYVAVVNGVDEYSVGPTTYDLPGGKVALSDAVGGLAAEVTIINYGEKSRTARTSVFTVGNRNVVVSSGMSSQFGTTMELLTETPEAGADLLRLLESATEGVVQIRQPGGYDGIDAFLAVLDSSERWIRPSVSQSPRRLWTLQVVEVEGWAPMLEARGFTLGDIADAYDGLTLQDIADDYATLLAIAQGDFS